MQPKVIDLPRAELSVFPEFDSHKRVVRFEDAETGLRGFIAIHNDNLGPVAGGTRMFSYTTEKEALRDVLRLSRAMTYKCAVAGVRHGGGKGVIIGDPSIDKNEALIRSYARIVNFFEGSFITGEDVGMTEDDVQVMLEESHYFIGKRGVAGDPSPYAARSVFATMQVAFEAVFGSSNFSNRTFAVKGVGKVGSNLVDLLMKTGAKIFVADIRKEVVDGIKTKHPSIEVVSSEEIHRSPVDVFSPCALGNDISEENAGQIKAKIVCGGANNQLASSVAGTLLSQRNILYVPDYVANAGGLINVVDELEKGGYSKSRVLERIERLKTTLRTILQTSEEKHESSAIVADHFAEHLFKHAVAQPTLVG